MSSESGRFCIYAATRDAFDFPHDGSLLFLSLFIHPPILFNRTHPFLPSFLIAQTATPFPRSPKRSTTTPSPPGIKSWTTVARKETPKSSFACAIRITSGTKLASALSASSVPGPNRESAKSCAPDPRPAPPLQAPLGRAAFHLPCTMALPYLPSL